jgi:hypothetical protein
MAEQPGAPLEPHALAYDKPLCASLDGFTLHAATRAGALDAAGREALLRYVLRPPLAQERLEQRPHGLVRITLKKAYSDRTVAVDMDPLSLLCRLATSVPPPRLHMVRYAGVLAARGRRVGVVPGATARQNAPRDGRSLRVGRDRRDEALSGQRQAGVPKRDRGWRAPAMGVPAEACRQANRPCITYALHVDGGESIVG